MKKLLSVILAFAMLTALMPMGVFATDENEGNEITYQEYCIERYDVAHTQEVLGSGAFVTEKDGKILIILREDLNGRLVFSSIWGGDMEGDFVLDLNGYTINPGELNEAIDLYMNFEGSLTITGSGTLKYGRFNTTNTWRAKIYCALAEGYDYYTLTVNGNDRFDAQNTETKELNGVDYDVVITQYGSGGTNPDDIYDYVTFNSTGGTAVSGMTVETSSKIAAPESPTKDGYTFGGWYKEEACENEWDFDNDTVLGDITLYAKWEENSPLNTYNDYIILRHDCEHAQSILGDLAEVTEITEVVDEVEKTTVVIKLTSDINGRLHIGTNDQRYWDGDFILDLNGHKIETDDTFGEALCLDNYFRGNLTITGSGIIKGGAHQIIYVGFGKLSFSLADGYTYYTLKTDGTNIYDEENTETKTRGSNVSGTELVIEQIFVPAIVYSITFDANGGTVDPASATTEADGKLATLPTPSRSNSYKFKGWYTASAGGTQVTTDTVFDADATIYAQWVYTESIGGGISIGVSGYTVKFNTNGGTDVANKSVTRNERLEEPIAPAKDGFEFDGWYTDEELTNVYDFDTKVTKDFTLYAKWTEIEKEEIETTTSFKDVKEGDWFCEDVQYVVGSNLMSGIAEDEFAPNNALTRAMLVTVLYRNEGEPAVNRSIPFADIDMGSWYSNAVVWAQQNGIVNGISDTEFAPDMNVTREQIATIMFRYAQLKGMDAMTLEENLHFADANEISEYAVSAMNWAVGTGLMNGKTDTTINSKDNTTRAEIAAILHRFLETDK